MQTARPKHADEISQFTVDLDDDTDSPTLFAQSLRARLGHTKAGKLLLMIAWTNDRSRLQFDKFPELLGMDDTAKTNSEERPLLSLCGRCTRFAFPFLLPGTALARVTHFKTDACLNETSAIEFVITRGKKLSRGPTTCPAYDIPWIKVEHAQCAWQCNVT
ncbi:hypothetical protein ACHAWF_009140 [Thalassiosira exigua]